MTNPQSDNKQTPPRRIWCGIFTVDPRTINIPRPHAPKPNPQRVFDWMFNYTDNVIANTNE